MFSYHHAEEADREADHEVRSDKHCLNLRQIVEQKLTLGFCSAQRSCQSKITTHCLGEDAGLKHDSCAITMMVPIVMQALPSLSITPFVSTPAFPLVLFGGVALPVVTVQTVSLAAAGLMLTGAFILWRRRMSTQMDRFVENSAATVLCISGSTHLVLLGLDSSGLLSSCCSQYSLMAMRHLSDVVVLPIWIFALGDAWNRSPRDLLSTASFAALGSMFAVGAAAATTANLQWGLLGSGVVCTLVASRSIAQDIPVRDVYNANVDQDKRLEVCGDVLALYCLTGTIVQCMGLAHAVGASQQMLEYALTDMLKLVGCHLLTKQVWTKQRRAFRKFILTETPHGVHSQERLAVAWPTSASSEDAEHVGAVPADDVADGIPAVHVALDAAGQEAHSESARRAWSQGRTVGGEPWSQVELPEHHPCRQAVDVAVGLAPANAASSCSGLGAAVVVAEVAARSSQNVSSRTSSSPICHRSGSDLD